MGRALVRFVGCRVRPLDPDNHAGGCKDLLDGLRHAGLIPGDEPWRIALQTEQVRVRHRREEGTAITIEPVNAPTQYELCLPPRPTDEILRETKERHAAIKSLRL